MQAALQNLGDVFLEQVLGGLFYGLFMLSVVLLGAAMFGTIEWSEIWTIGSEWLSRPESWTVMGFMLVAWWAYSLGHSLHSFVCDVAALMVAVALEQGMSESSVHVALLFLGILAAWPLGLLVWVALGGDKPDEYKEDNSWFDRNAFWAIFFGGLVLQKAYRSFVDDE